jgi:hypothetical protein
MARAPESTDAKCPKPKGVWEPEGVHSVGDNPSQGMAGANSRRSNPQAGHPTGPDIELAGPDRPTVGMPSPRMIDAPVVCHGVQP